MSFTATYHGTCSSCDETIAPGQRIERTTDDDGWRHTDCHAMPEKAVCACERCFLVHNGACF